MDSTQSAPSAQPPVLPAPAAAPRRRNAVTIKLLFIAALVLLLQVPLSLINDLRRERARNRGIVEAPADARTEVRSAEKSASSAAAPAEGYRMTERSLKYGILVMTLTFGAFFLFETLVALRLHPVHYGLVGAALCLFYLALLALGEVLSPGWAYVGAAVASSALITLYGVAILRSYGRASTIAGLLAAVHGTLYVVLRMDDYALLAGTAALFVALAAVMFFTRNVDWSAEEAGKAARG
jgi:inner membrane protein involved in colicin E2 resistance